MKVPPETGSCGMKGCTSARWGQMGVKKWNEFWVPLCVSPPETLWGHMRRESSWGEWPCWMEKNIFFCILKDLHIDFLRRIRTVKIDSLLPSAKSVRVFRCVIPCQCPRLGTHPVPVLPVTSAAPQNTTMYKREPSLMLWPGEMHIYLHGKNLSLGFLFFTPLVLIVNLHKTMVRFLVSNVSLYGWIFFIADYL